MSAVYTLVSVVHRAYLFLSFLILPLQYRLRRHSGSLCRTMFHSLSGGIVRPLPSCSPEAITSFGWSALASCCAHIMGKHWNSATSTLKVLEFRKVIAQCTKRCWGRRHQSLQPFWYQKQLGRNRGRLKSNRFLRFLQKWNDIIQSALHFLSESFGWILNNI